MRRNVLNIYWGGRVVGQIVDPTFDHFDYYGKWSPGSDAATEEFLSALRDGEEPEVIVGEGEPSLKGTVGFEPDDEIEIKIRP